jgi:hypothetical protein
MGDVWLTEHFERENGYDLRIDIADCAEWEVVSNAEFSGATQPHRGASAGTEG